MSGDLSEDDEIDIEDDPLEKRCIENRGNGGELHLNGHDPRKTYFMPLSVGNLDGSTKMGSCEYCEGIFETEAEAVDRARRVNSSYPTTDIYIYKVEPIAKVWRGPTHLTKLNRGTASRATKKKRK